MGHGQRGRSLRRVSRMVRSVSLWGVRARGVEGSWEPCERAVGGMGVSGAASWRA